MAKKKEKAIVLDIDDTISYFLRTLVHIYNKFNSTSLVESDIQTWEFDDLQLRDVRGNVVTGKALRETFNEYESHGLYSILPPIPEAKHALNIIKKLGYKVILLTSRKPEFQKQTILNLQHHDMPYDEVMFEKDKVKKIKELSKLYDIEAFADDRYETVIDVYENCKVKKCYLINASYNKNKELDADIIRISNVLECIRNLKDLTL